MSVEKKFVDPFKVKSTAVEEKPTPVLDERDDPNTPTGTLQVYQYIDAEWGRRKPDTSVNRASSAPRCPRQRWYQKEGYEAEPITPRVIVNFMLGDLTEHAVKHLIHEACVGEGKLYSEVDFGREVGTFTVQNGKVIKMYDQPDTFAQLGEIRVVAHADGYGKRNADGKWELIEIKSAADYGFEEFKESGPGDYLKQAMVNLQTDKAKELGAAEVRFWYLKKNTGNLFDRLYPFDAALALRVTEEYRLAEGKEAPARPYLPKLETYRTKPTGRSVLPWQCAYCNFNKHCYPNAELEFKSGKPVYVVKETQ